jgi:hypothetical protein
MKRFVIAFHPTRPFIAIQYTEKPIPWNRVLVYIAHHDKHKYALLYNSSFYYASKPSFYIWTSEYMLIVFLTKKSAREKFTINKEIKLYEFSTGKTVGYLGFPAEEKCKYFDGREGQSPIKTHDMRQVACICTIAHQDKSSLQITIYNTNHAYIGNDVVYTLLYNNTLLVPLKRGSYFGLAFFFDKGNCIFIINTNDDGKTLLFVRFSNKHPNLTQKQRYILSVPGEMVNCLSPACNIELGQCFRCYQTANSSLKNVVFFNLGCISRKELSKEMEWFVAQFQHISVYEANKYKNEPLNYSQGGVDTHKDILQINHDTNKNGKTVYHVKKFRVEQ